MTPTITPEAARLARYLSKMPTLDPSWSPEIQVGWMRCFNALAALAKQDAAPTSASTVPEWLPIETAPKDGYILCFEDGAMRLKLRHDGQWIEADYPFIRVVGPGWEDHVVGNEAKRMTGGYSLGVAEGCPNPTHWMPLPNPPGACSVTDGEAKK